jgi:hypothetical protein
MLCPSRGHFVGIVQFIFTNVKVKYKIKKINKKYEIL